MIYPRHLTWPQTKQPRLRAPGRVRDRETTVKTGWRAWSRKKLVKTILASIALGLMSVVAICGIVLTVMILRIRPTLPSISQIALFQPQAGTRIYSSDGVLLATLQFENRQPVALSSVSPKLVDATIAVEDSRFFEHHGIDYRGVARAAVANLINHDVTGQGGSTITQQLARNVSDFGLSKEKSLQRKLREAMVAVRIEQVFDKNEILELYLNQIYYGSGAYGAEAAARTYFGKGAKNLTLAESALLAGLPQRPHVYSPYTDKVAAINRRNVVLKRMLDTGKIAQAEYEKARLEPVKLAGRKSSQTVYKAPYFVDWVVQDLVRRYGVDKVYSGWTVVTTLDWKMQQAAERALRTGLSHGARQGALVSIDPHSGEVRAMVGGVDYDKDRFNAVTQGKRQPGSAFKPIVYAAALDMGVVTLDMQIKDVRLDIPTGSGSKVWTVHNYGGGYGNGDEMVYDALRKSTNTVAVQVAQLSGIDTVINCAHRLGITTELAPYLPLALGASAVRPIELCSAYGVFAAGGELYEPAGVRSIKDSRGHEIEQPSAYRRKTTGVLGLATIDDINTGLWGAVHEGTGGAAAHVPNAYGKTGTTSDYRDAWFVGYTPELVTAVWVARPYRDKKGVVHYEPMPDGTGGHAAAPIWARFMTAVVPVQKKVNRLRHQGPWSIKRQPPPQPIDLDALAEGQKAEQEVMQAAQEEWMRDLDHAPGVGARTYDTGGYSGGRQAHWQDYGYGGSVRQAHYAETTGDSRRMSADESDQLIAVCADSGRPANEWCPTTVLVNTSASRAPTGYCRMHHAPDGER